MFVAHLVLTMEDHFRSEFFAGFDRVERWTFEDLTADFPGHLQSLGVQAPRVARLMGVGYDTASVLNMAEVLGWAAELAGEGLRTGADAMAEPA